MTEKALEQKTLNLWKTYDAINELIRFADTKATAILAIDGVIAGFFFSNIETIQNVLSQKPVAIIPLIMAVGFILISLGASAYCIAPRLKMNKSECPIFFYDISKYPSVEAYKKAAESEMSNDKIERHLTDQIWANSKIAERKYEAVTMSVIVFVALVITSIAFMFLASGR
jgi:hypothetical protein